MATIGVLLSEIDLVSAGDVLYPPGGRLGPRWQHDVQLVLVHTGSARIRVDDCEPALHPAGSVVLLLPGHREQFEFDEHEPTHHSWIQARIAEPPAELDSAPRALPASAALTDLVGEAVAAARTPLPTARPLLAALAAAAIWRYLGESQSREQARTDAVDRARGFLHHQLSDPDLSLAGVAAAAHVTPAHLVRRFRAELGITPMAYLWQRRVATGIDLLTNTGLPVGVVAARCGFKSVYHFSRRVKERTGSSPTALRSARWSQSASSSE
jgi:AraC-like DNA-binding protein